jgi:hypothetical protein
MGSFPGFGFYMNFETVPPAAGEGMIYVGAN